jgi:hypothetical protein
MVLKVEQEVVVGFVDVDVDVVPVDVVLVDVVPVDVVDVVDVEVEEFTTTLEAGSRVVVPA